MEGAQGLREVAGIHLLEAQRIDVVIPCQGEKFAACGMLAEVVADDAHKTPLLRVADRTSS
jgi:hypothetical protein